MDSLYICINSSTLSKLFHTVYLLELLDCGRSTIKPIEDTPLSHEDHISSLGDIPWMTVIYSQMGSNDWKAICGGSLISPRIVLTGKCTNNISKHIVLQY